MMMMMMMIIIIIIIIIIMFCNVIRNVRPYLDLVPHYAIS